MKMIGMPMRDKNIIDRASIEAFEIGLRIKPPLMDLATKGLTIPGGLPLRSRAQHAL
jgi:hypothetical protein